MCKKEKWLRWSVRSAEERVKDESDGIGVEGIKCVTSRSAVCGSITSKVFVMIFDIETKTEENIIPEKHLHFAFLSGINGHDVAFDYSSSSPSGRDYKIWMDLGHKAMFRQYLITHSITYTNFELPWKLLFLW